MTLAALYSAAGANASTQLDTGSEFRNIEITDQVRLYNEAMQQDRSRGDSSENTTSQNAYGRNIHRAIAVSADDKVPFRFQDGLTGEQTYIIELADKPAALYQGGIAHLQATAPRQNNTPYSLNAHNANKLNVQSQAVQAYTDYLNVKQADLLSQISGIVGSNPKVLGQYRLAFNGMAIRMTQDQAASVAEQPGVRSVTLEQIHQLHTDVGPEHIGADQFWSGSVAGTEYRGEGIVVGVLDTGINTDHPSFSDTPADGYTFTNPLGEGVYLGDCENDEFVSMCNDKLIGVRSYEVITDSYWDAAFQPEQPWWNITDPKRPANGEDYDGHGSHTASTAAGNTLYDVDYLVPEFTEQSDGLATGLKLPMVSGVAPRANVIMYQVCFPGDGSYTTEYTGCPGSALMAGIEDAIADGVDVINYSIGTTFGAFPWESPIEMAFLAAREAGISVSASAGNSYDPEYASQARGAIDHLSPWLTSVAATTHGREFKVNKALTNATGGDQAMPDISGGGITGSYTGPLVDAKAYGWEYEKCNDAFPADFFAVDPSGNPWPGDVAPIVICKRGDIARVDKAVNVAAGGAGGLILRNASSRESISNDPFMIPGIHISHGDYSGDSSNGYYGLDDWLRAGTGHTITISDSEVYVEMGSANYVADFSSRGPNLQVPDVMSPNVAAPGVNIYAAYADEMPFSASPLPADFSAISGTSMAAPHVAGAMALLQQANPDWTPAMIQSALMTTASIEGVTRSRDGNPYDPVNAGYDDAGSGVINVARAQKAGLLLDESASNYRAANPRNGGTPSNLNVPYLFNMSCAGSCTWMRTFTATEDGTWDLSAEAMPIEGAEMLSVDVMPKQISLKAGETQSVVVSAEILDVEAVGVDSSQIVLPGRITLTPQQSDLSEQHLPLSVRYEGDGLPLEVGGPIHRKQGHLLTQPIQTDDIQSFNYRVSGMAKAVRHELMLSRADTRINNDRNTTEEVTADPGNEVIFFEVPEGTKRLILEVAEADPMAFTALDMGMDVNMDGQIQWAEEAICYSWTDMGDFCAINDPAPGTYWAVIGNWKYEYLDPDNGKDRILASLAIIPDTDGGNLTVEGPASTDGLEPFSLKLNYDLPEAEEGDLIYGVVGLGSDAYNDSNLGEFTVKLRHTGADTEITASQSAAKAGDLIDYRVSLAPNLLGAERDFRLTTTLPSTFTLIEDSVTLGSVGLPQEALTVEGNTLIISGTQASSQDTPRHYVFSTNADDPMCKVPYGDDPTFFDLNEAGYYPLGISGYSNQVMYIPLSSNGLPNVPLYGNEPRYMRDFIAFSPFGYVQFDELRDRGSYHLEFNDSFQFSPDTMVAPLWRGDIMMPDEEFSRERERYINGVYAIVTGKHYVVQWDGGEEFRHPKIGSTPDQDAYYNIEAIISTELNFEPGDYEMIYAYDALESANNNLGSVGLHGFWGERGTMGPYSGWYNDGFAYNDVDEKISAGTVICADYRGPEQSAVELNFTVRINSAATGTIGDVVVESHYDDSELVTVSHSLNVPGNITLAALADQTMEENSTLEGLSVMYHDLRGTTNGIEVSGEHISATVHGNESGATFDITPEAYWFGTTEVTVTVYDMANPSDAASTSFMLEVLSDGVEAPAPEVVEPESKSSSGSLGYLALLMLALTGWRRRQA
ncbi:S8 family serine peptidase [Ferrimonas gelatinilytica]|uniref:S8 family serine peptidase n=1 Tax=Ferrimonas gelatinilytica TaxID=1255257 RepID=A0ABP9SD50_9GAMM